MSIDDSFGVNFQKPWMDERNDFPRFIAWDLSYTVYCIYNIIRFLASTLCLRKQQKTKHIRIFRESFSLTFKNLLKFHPKYVQYVRHISL